MVASTCSSGRAHFYADFTADSNVRAYAPLIQLIRQESDLTATYAATDTAPADGTSQTSHISKGAIAGIAIGGLLGLLAFLGVAVYLFRTRRRSAREGGATLSARTTLEIGGNEISEMADSSTATAMAPKAKVDYAQENKSHEQSHELEAMPSPRDTPLSWGSPSGEDLSGLRPNSVYVVHEMP